MEIDRGTGKSDKGHLDILVDFSQDRHGKITCQDNKDWFPKDVGPKSLIDNRTNLTVFEGETISIYTKGAAKATDTPAFKEISDGNRVEEIMNPSPNKLKEIQSNESQTALGKQAQKDGLPKMNFEVVGDNHRQTAARLEYTPTADTSWHLSNLEIYMDIESKQGK